MNHVLVTGADGFIGSHLVELLVTSGYSVTAFCCYNSFGSNGWLDHISHDTLSCINIIQGDIRDYQSVLMASRNIDCVFHLAALIGIPYSYTAPSSYVDTNITGTLNVLQACRANNVSRVVHTSTSEVYGTAQYVPIDELHPIVCQSPYSATKSSADSLAFSFYKSFDLPVTIIRPFNTYGPRQSTRAVIPTIINQILNGNSSIRLGTLTPTRDFNYVSDTCSAFLSVALSNSTVGRIINACSSFEISISDVVDTISNVIGVDVDVETDSSRLRPSSSEVERLFGDNTLITTLTDWAPMYSGLDGFSLGIAKTVDWFRLNNSSYPDAHSRFHV